MAKPAESAGSDVSEMKVLFKLAHTKPVFAAFALGADGKAIIKLDKMMKGKALGKALKGSDPKLKSLCCGIVEIDPSDATTAKFTMDKAASGIEGKLIQALKGTGVSKVNIGVGGGEAGPGGDASDDDDDDDAATPAQPSPSAAASPPAASAAPSPPAPPGAAPASPPPAAPAPPTAATPASPSAAAAPASPPASGAAPGQDAGALTATLTGLVKQMMTAISGNPALKATLVPLATSAQGALKQGNLQQASTAIEGLQQALAGGAGAAPNGAAAPPPSPTSAAAPPPPPMGAGGPPPAAGPGDGGMKPSDTPAGKAHAKAGIAWKATHAKMTGDIDKLTSEFTKAFKDHAQADELEKAFQAKIDGVLGTLDQSLSAKLGELDGAKDAAAHAKIVADAKKILAQYQQTVSSNPTIAQLDKNPFAPIALEKTLTTTLNTLAKVLV